MKLRVIVAFGAAALLLSACATDPVPSGYAGPVSNVADTFNVQSDGGISFFYLDKINGKTVDNGLTQTIVANSGRGFSMTPAPYERPVPASPATFTITGRTHYAAPILDLVHKGYQVSGDISFTPQPNHTYSVKGVLAAEGSSVWIEDENGDVVDKKIEKKNAALGFLQK